MSRERSSTADYSRILVRRGRQGAARGLESYLHGTRLAAFVQRSARAALTPAVLGACVGVLGGYHAARHRAARRALACGFLGCALGFGAGVVWQSRGLAASMASAALLEISRARDSHWLEGNPIDYA